MLSFSSLPQESRSNLGKSGKVTLNIKRKNIIEKAREIIKTFPKIVKANKNSLGVKSPVDGVDTGREGERGQPVDFLLVVVRLRVEEERTKQDTMKWPNLQHSFFHLLLSDALTDEKRFSSEMDLKSAGKQHTKLSESQL